jgi:ribonuclease HI
MDPVNGSWDESMVRELFCVQDVTTILSIPTDEDSEDEWAWHFDEKGLFSVKSAYRLHRQLSHVLLGQQESSQPEQGFHWKEIWKAECTPNVQQFLWRIAHNSLPHRLSLQRRGMDIDPICPLCSRLNEDGCHLFLWCKTVKSIWRNNQMEDIQKQLIECTSPQEVISQILHLRHDQKVRTISLLWWRWKDRCKIVAGEKGIPECHLLRLINETANEFDQFCTKAKDKPTNSWVAPSANELKLNIDGGFRADDRTGGWGFIVRDSDGEAVGTGAGAMPYAYDALNAEAAACLAGIQWSRYWGICNIQVETDSQKLVQAITTNAHDLSVNGHLFREIKCFASLNFSSFSIKFCPRACNKAADALATYGMSLGHESPAIWPDGAPEFVQVFVASDLAESTS